MILAFRPSGSAPFRTQKPTKVATPYPDGLKGHTNPYEDAPYTTNDSTASVHALLR